MTMQEFNNWKRYQMTNAGHWTVDPIRDGVNRSDLLVYNALPQDPTKGIYVLITGEGTLSTGAFEDALPHMGDATYQVKKFSKFRNKDEAFSYAYQKLGLKFLVKLFSGGLPFHSALDTFI